jgi:hypothetical protein
LHLARKKGTYSDQPIDNAAFQFLGAGEDFIDFVKHSEKYTSGADGKYQNGTFAHSLVNQFCTRSTEEMNPPPNNSNN